MRVPVLEKINSYRYYNNGLHLTIIDTTKIIIKRICLQQLLKIRQLYQIYTTDKNTLFKVIIIYRARNLLEWSDKWSVME